MFVPVKNKKREALAPQVIIVLTLSSYHDDMISKHQSCSVSQNSGPPELDLIAGRDALADADHPPFDLITGREALTDHLPMNITYYTLHPTPYILHPEPYTLRTESRTTPYT